jgi:hypothetical protein
MLVGKMTNSSLDSLKALTNNFQEANKQECSRLLFSTQDYKLKASLHKLDKVNHFLQELFIQRRWANLLEATLVI